MLEGIDLFGADVNNGTPGKSIQDCCATCSALDACGAFTFDPLSGTCYLKSASGWDRKAGAGLKSVIIGKEAGQTAKPSPEQPKPSPEQPKPSSAAGQSELLLTELYARQFVHVCCALLPMAAPNPTVLLQALVVWCFRTLI